MRSFLAALASTLFISYALSSPPLAASASDFQAIPPEPQKISVTGTLPAFISPAHLGEFLLAVREASYLSSSSRIAAESLSQKFSDDDRPMPPDEAATAFSRVAAAEAGDKPYIFAAADFEPSLFDAKSPRRVIISRRPATTIRKVTTIRRHSRLAQVPKRPSPNTDRLRQPELSWLYQ